MFTPTQSGISKKSFSEVSLKVFSAKKRKFVILPTKEQKQIKMNIKIEPIEGARIITKADVEEQQDPEKIPQITDEEWQEAINVYQNEENINAYLKNKAELVFIPFRKKVFAIFYSHYQEMIELNTSNLEELYEQFVEYMVELMPSRFIYVTGKVRAIKSELDWDENKSENLDQLLQLTEEEVEKIGQTAPCSFNFDAEKFKDTILRQPGKKPEELKFTRDEADSIVDTLLEGEAQRKKNAPVIIELYSVIVPGLMNIYLYNISHLSDDEIRSLRERFVQDIYDFFSSVLNKVWHFAGIQKVKK